MAREDDKLLGAYVPAELSEVIGAVAKLLGLTVSDLIRASVAKVLLGLGEEEITPVPRVERCRNGHQRSEANTYMRPDGWRECRVCKREAVYRNREANLEKVRERDRKANLKRYYENHEAELERRRRYRKENREKIREQQREWSRRFREKKRREAGA